MSYTNFFTGMSGDSFDTSDFDFSDLFDKDIEDVVEMGAKERIGKYIDNYYYFNPDTLMPLLLLTLAKKNRLKVTENAAPAPGAYISFELEALGQQKWARTDSELKKRVKGLKKAGVKSVDIEMELDTQTAAIFNLFKENDEVTVVREHHHRMGRLVNHMVDSAAYKVQQKYAALRLVRILLDNKEYIDENFIEVYNYILEASGLQPKRPRLEIARVIKGLAEYDGKGLVYNPFAGIGLAGAVLEAGENLYADADPNPTLFAAGLLLNYGMGGNNIHFVQRNSMEWMHEAKPKYVVSTYRGNIDGKSAFAFCYAKSMEVLGEDGKYVGVVTSSDFFEADKKHHPELAELIKESVKNDTLDSIVVMPYNETVVVFNKNKEYKGHVRIYNRLEPFTNVVDIEDMLEDVYSCDYESVKDIKKSKYNLKKYVVTDFSEREDMTVVPISDYLTRLEKRVYPTKNMDYRQKAMLCIDSNSRYYPMAMPMQGLIKKPFDTLLKPAYKLTNDALILNNIGDLEPRLFDASNGDVFFDEGLAFELNEDVNRDWIVQELNSPYVQDQLFPYGKDAMLPNYISEEAVMSLQIFEDMSKLLPNHNGGESGSEVSLPQGFVLHDKEHHYDYEIIDALNNGAFGITYRAIQKDLANGEEKEVAVKEFYMSYDMHCWRENNKVVIDNEAVEDIGDYKSRFKREAGIMMRLGQDSNNHIMRGLNYFESEETDTAYYVMNIYENGSLDDLLRRVGPLQEKDVIEHVVKPLAVALNAVHAENILHLDIKPNNIMLDENMDATLTDFGIAKEYNAETMRQVNEEEPTGTRVFAAPEQCGYGRLSGFDRPADIYSLSGTIYTILTYRNPHPIMPYSDDEVRIKENLTCSEQTKDAIVKGLMLSPEHRQQSVQEWLNMFPGCEDIKLG